MSPKKKKKDRNKERLEREREREKNAIIVPQDIREFVQKILDEQSEEIDNAIAFEVETKYEERFKVFEELLSLRDKRIEELEKKVSDLEGKRTFSSLHSTFPGTVSNVRNMFERQAPRQTPPPVNRAPATTVAQPAPRTAQSSPNPSTPSPSTSAPATQQHVLPPDSVANQFTMNKKKVLLYPVTEKHIVTCYQVLTNDLAIYSTNEVLFGEKHEEARRDAAIDFFRDEICLESHRYRMEKVEYHETLSRQTLIVTMENEAMVKRAHISAAQVKNSNVKLETSWPSFTYHRRRRLFDWVKAAKEKNPGTMFQVRLGINDLQAFMKEPGDYYHPIPLAYFAELAGEDFASLPPLMAKKPPVAPGRGTQNKRVASSPASGNTVQRGRLEEDDNEDEDEQEEDDSTLTESGNIAQLEAGGEQTEHIESTSGVSQVGTKNNAS